MATHISCDCCGEFIKGNERAAVVQFQRQGDPEPWDMCGGCVQALKGFSKQCWEKKNGQG